ncbi:hypothetical protein FPV67DRAFT_1455649 [Lyophyllum atratum]|nr:hypothetical protein FPV67DRAFT_1455649 [Lyophyllum atratum]
MTTPDLGGVISMDIRSETPVESFHLCWYSDVGVLGIASRSPLVGPPSLRLRSDASQIDVGQTVTRGAPVPVGSEAWVPPGCWDDRSGHRHWLERHAVAWEVTPCKAWNLVRMKDGPETKSGDAHVVTEKSEVEGEWNDRELDPTAYYTSFSGFNYKPQLFVLSLVDSTRRFYTSFLFDTPKGRLNTSVPTLRSSEITTPEPLAMFFTTLYSMIASARTISSKPFTTSGTSNANRQPITLWRREHCSKNEKRIARGVLKRVMKVHGDVLKEARVKELVYMYDFLFTLITFHSGSYSTENHCNGDKHHSIRGFQRSGRMSFSIHTDDVNTAVKDRKKDVLWVYKVDRNATPGLPTEEKDLSQSHVDVIRQTFHPKSITNNFDPAKLLRLY